MNRDAPSPGGLEADDHRVAAVRRVVICAAFAFVLLQPAFQLLRGPANGLQWFQLTGAVVLAGLVIRRVATTGLTDQRIPVAELTFLVGLAIALFVVGGVNWLGML